MFSISQPHVILLRTMHGVDLEKDDGTLASYGFSLDMARGDPNLVTLRMIPRESVLWR